MRSAHAGFDASRRVAFACGGKLELLEQLSQPRKRPQGLFHGQESSCDEAYHTLRLFSRLRVVNKVSLGLLQGHFNALMPGFRCISACRDFRVCLNATYQYWRLYCND